MASKTESSFDQFAMKLSTRQRQRWWWARAALETKNYEIVKPGDNAYEKVFKRAISLSTEFYLSHPELPWVPFEYPYKEL